VASLQIAWIYRHGDMKNRRWLPDRVNRATSFESTPLVVDGRLIFTTPFNRVIALAGPISYKLQPEGKQFPVVAPGGHMGLDSKQGDYVIAYALP